jgi:hypothetical protein
VDGEIPLAGIREIVAAIAARQKRVAVRPHVEHRPDETRCFIDTRARTRILIVGQAHAH